MPTELQKIQVVDSHTGGEPTRTILSERLTTGSGSVAEQMADFRDSRDQIRSALMNEPRGNEVLVGAMLCPPADPSCVAGVFFFNNIGYLNMCGHGTIGLMATLAHLGRVAPSAHRIETPVGIVTATLHEDRSVSIENVPSYRVAHKIAVHIPELGVITGDVAWGGNWFFLAESPLWSRLDFTQVARYTELAGRIRCAVNTQGFPQVDHVELFGEPQTPHGNARSFVLCPGHAYDRSACGTGTSAKLACLAASGDLAEGETWVQESIIGSTMTAAYRWLDRRKGTISPTVTGTAYITAEATMVIDPADPFRWGIQRHQQSAEVWRLA